MQGFGFSPFPFIFLPTNILHYACTGCKVSAGPGRKKTGIFIRRFIVYPAVF
jgi:hypothetical protein